jgi:serine/threonine-protein kinase HipA
VSGLNVWLGETCVGTLRREGKVVTFTFNTSTVADHPASPLISVAMLVRAATWRGAVPEAFFGGLLPEGEIRRMIAHDFKIDSVDDDVAMLEKLGRDCAGALQILPATAMPDPHGESLEPLSEAQVAERLRELRHNPLGVDERVRVSLAGMQEKMVLAADSDGWCLPLGGAPSTHIFKPPHAFLSHSVANEALCMRIAHHADVLTAAVRREWFDDRETLIVNRYDREHVDGRVKRIHQEDFCQAHALPTHNKYQEIGGPSLKSCADMISNWTGGRESLMRLLDISMVNIAVGNADAHAKNFSLIHHRSGKIELAPAYDIMSTLFYPQVSKTLGMYVNSVTSVENVTLADLRAEAIGWGLPADDVDERIDAVVTQLPAALNAAADEVDPPEELADWLSQRFTALAKYT